MSRIIGPIRRFVWDESGPTSVEYAIMLAFILMVVFGAISSLGTTTNNSFHKAATSFNSAS
jgi:pilus assembly protein Flp/PilA